MIFVESTLPAARGRLLTLAQGAPLIDAAKLLRNPGTDMVVVCDAEGVLSGILTKTNVVEQMSRCEGSSCCALVSAVMTRDVLMCRSGERVDEVWNTMKARGLKNVPVVDEQSRPLGVLNARDALQALMEEVEYEESLLRDYVMTIGYH